MGVDSWRSNRYVEFMKKPIAKGENFVEALYVRECDASTPEFNLYSDATFHPIAFIVKVKKEKTICILL